MEAKTDVLRFEGAGEIVRNYNRLAITNCTCGLTARKYERPLEACIRVNNAAAYSVALGTGREIGLEEVMEHTEVRPEKFVP